MTFQNKNTAFLSTYPPRKCGIATFTQDVSSELDKLNLLNKTKIIAVSDSKYDYDKKVIMEINQHDRKSYIETAKKINNSDIDILMIEHEYGIFGGEWGEYILDLVKNLTKPFITTFHTVLPEPNEKQKEILNVLGKYSSSVVTMAKNTVDILQNVYGINRNKIRVIPHGVPLREVKSRDYLKNSLGYNNKTVISTFGLISPGKGLEYGIEAISKVVRDYKDVIYLILGQTHPAIKQKFGESYRNRLVNLVDALGISSNVKFVNKYLTKDEIIQYLTLSDIYMTPYLGKDQAVSGTLAYAAGYGRVIVSTPYSYAKEMLSNGRGLIARFNDSDSLARCIKYIIKNPDIKSAMEQKTKKVGKDMMWPNVAKKYAELFASICQNSEKTNMVVSQS